MQFSITDFYQRPDEDFTLLQRRTDACARLGRSYELPCTLPDTCAPTDVMIGFCRTGAQYMLYIRPQVCCTTANSLAEDFFTPGIRSFPNFAALTEHLRRVGQAFSAQERTPLQSLFHRINAALGQQVLGQKAAVEAAAFRLHNHICKRCPSRPLSMVLYGRSGVGKSELGKAIAPVLQKLLPEQNWKCVWTELNTFTQPHSVSRLIGSPPGYVGYDDPPVLENVRESPHTVFVFDELDKAHPEVLKILMSILDEGRCTARRADEHGQRELDFRRCIFVFTTNMDLSAAPKHPLGFALSPSAAAPLPLSDDLSHRLFIRDESARRAMIRAGVPQEIACRFTALIEFQSLSEASRLQITIKQITALGREFGLNIVSVSPGLAAALTPQDAVSIRSTPAILEGMLTPVFAGHIARSSTRFVHLSGSLETIILNPAGYSASTP